MRLMSSLRKEHREIKCAWLSCCSATKLFILEQTKCVGRTFRFMRTLNSWHCEVVCLHKQVPGHWLLRTEESQSLSRHRRDAVPDFLWWSRRLASASAMVWRNSDTDTDNIRNDELAQVTWKEVVEISSKDCDKKILLGHGYWNDDLIHYQEWLPQ